MTKTTMFASLLLGTMLTGGTALAQTSGQVERLQRLESQVAALGGSVEGGRIEVAQASPSLAADMEIRLQHLERAISELTGKFEETSYQVSQMKDRLERVNADIDFRLKELESKGGGAGGGGAFGSGGGGDAFGPSKGSAPAKGADKVAEKPADKAPEKPAQTAAVAAVPSNAGPEKQYEHAFELLRNADYDKAEKAFQDFLAKNKGHQLAGNAQYWLGESYYVRNKFAEAAQAFAEGVSKYPKNSKAADNLLKLGMSLQQLNQKKDACTAYNQLMTKFPDASASVKRRADTERRRLNCPT
ncbi:tol-pal system protein YbgF [Azospirillum thermophilum]|uniref:Cell division coordinator CpoB n=1 Tax=Azospirillum thermophilum TaxID=2202148 RepID=A0A2S2CMC1_9PROT|nr:tol-pal system protein YbgF [Azospirillum thermophilum]AWK85520.1 tol-pal system protein YbgF [Azospirillum thermophilum]